MALQIYRAKPNPDGRDRFGSTVPTSQIAGEWVDLLNTGLQPFNLGGVALQHVAYPSPLTMGVWREVMLFPDFSLGVSEILRVHSGRKVDLSVLYPEDQSGAEWHIFTGNNYYVWNNDRGDAARLVVSADDPQREVQLDKAEYISIPPEGVVLSRVGDLLI